MGGFLEAKGPMNNSKSCHPVTIARNSVTHIQRCEDCGCISVHLGHATVRLDEHAVHALWSALGHAIASVSSADAAELSPARGVA